MIGDPHTVSGNQKSGDAVDKLQVIVEKFPVRAF
jgi:hypothetical protein